MPSVSKPKIQNENITTTLCDIWFLKLQVTGVNFAKNQPGLSKSKSKNSKMAQNDNKI